MYPSQDSFFTQNHLNSGSRLPEIMSSSIDNPAGSNDIVDPAVMAHESPPGLAAAVSLSALLSAVPRLYRVLPTETADVVSAQSVTVRRSQLVLNTNYRSTADQTAEDSMNIINRDAIC